MRSGSLFNLSRTKTQLGLFGVQNEQPVAIRAALVHHTKSEIEQRDFLAIASKRRIGVASQKRQQQTAAASEDEQRQSSEKFGNKRLRANKTGFLVHVHAKDLERLLCHNTNRRWALHTGTASDGCRHTGGL